MRIAIIGAMDEEVELIKQRLENIKIEKHNNYEFYLGNYKRISLIVVVSKIGKVSAGILLGTLFSIYSDIDKVINIGVSGGVKEYVSPGEVVISSKLSYADVDVRAFNYQFGQMAGLPLFYISDLEMIKFIKSKYELGVILTADAFQTDPKIISDIVKLYFSAERVLCFDMESTAFAQGCYFNNVSFVAIRAISDVIGSENQESQYENNLKIACDKAHHILIEILEGVNNEI